MQYQTFANYYDKMMHDVDYDMWADYIDGLIRSYGGGKTLLDCACGTGNMTIRIYDKGYNVIGSDISTDMLAIAQGKARAKGCTIPMICQSMGEIALHRKVDVVNCSCDGLNYLLNLSEVKAFFESARNVLNENGLLLFDLSTQFKLEYILGDRFMGEDTEDYTYLWQNCYDKKSGLLSMDLTFFVRDGKLYRRFCEQHVQSSYSVSKLTEALEQSGFKVEAVLEAFTEKKPDKESQRIQFVARKIDG